MLKKILTLVLLTTSLTLATPGEHLKVGTKLPTVKEADQFGKIRTLNELKGSNGTLFVVFRSADW